MVKVISYLIIILLGNIVQKSKCDNIVDDARFDVEGLPKGYDEWCKVWCSSFFQCADLFADDYIDLRLLTDFSALDGPGKSLTSNIFMGDTISRQTFETQFVLDISIALVLSPCQVYVISVSPEEDSQSWDSERVFVNFRMFPVDVNKVRSLTQQVQNMDSVLYSGIVTAATDALFGLVALRWDVSLKLLYSIEIVGQNSVENADSIKFLNKGSERWCENVDNADTHYCEFELFFREDISMALSVEEKQVDVVFIKGSGRDSVIVSFRFLPSRSRDANGQDSSWIERQISELSDQVKDIESPLYKGNITYKVDPVWGVSNTDNTYRTDSKYLRRSVKKNDSDEYERCKTAHRCSRGWVHYNQSTSKSSSSMQTFSGGEHKEIPLFSDFEDWRQGTQGWRQNCHLSSERCANNHPKYDNTAAPFGGHWSPFDFNSLGPSIPSFNTTSNNGLVLNNKSLIYQEENLRTWIEDIKSYIQWLEIEMHVTSLDAKTRSRADILRDMQRTQEDYMYLLNDENMKLAKLSQSQCRNITCNLVFNTSSLELSGAINATGVVATTLDGTEVAVWSFDSIDLAQEVNVTLTGQRAMALLSRSSIRVNTTLHPHPGTLGGFPGGLSVSRKPMNRFVSVCSEGSYPRKFLDHCDGPPCCPGDQPLLELVDDMISNNVNGPGSGSVRVYLKTIETIGPIKNEVQTITTNADVGQVLGGGYKLHFNGYTTGLIPHTITAKKLKQEMESSLNAGAITSLSAENRTNIVPGIGDINIVRLPFGTSGGYIWSVTFATAVGNVGNMDSGNLTVTNLLNGIGASITVATLTEGNTIGGTFSLTFLGLRTRSIEHDVTSNNLKSILMEEITPLLTADIIRSDPINNCNDGFCDNGPSRAGGYIWTLTLTTKVGNISPNSPTSTEFDTEGEISEMVALNKLTGCVDSICPRILISDGHGRSNIKAMKKLDIKKPFSLSFGGAGGGYGGYGGHGFGDNLPGATYGDDYISYLCGGSGGALGYTQPFEAAMFDDPRARGGSGGGAIELIASNDIIIGKRAIINCGGETGSSGLMTAGGGGSGGTVLLSAGGVIHHQGTISANGGNGGYASQPQGRSEIEDRHGSGGGGGRVALYGQSIVKHQSSRLEAEGGQCFTDGIIVRNRDCNGKKGTIHEKGFISQDVFIDNSKGAAGTSSSIGLRGYRPRPSLPPSRRISPTQSGPEYVFDHPKRPGRISFFVSKGSDDPSEIGWGAMLEVREEKWSDIVNSPVKNFTSAIGVFVGQEMMHGANLRGLPYDTTHISTMRTFHPKIAINRWYKIDIRLYWGDRPMYEIFLDDSLAVDKTNFDAMAMSSIAVSNYHPDAMAWFDEIFVGEDDTMGFRCPIGVAPGLFSADRPIWRDWKSNEIGRMSHREDMQHHDSHISRRPLYKRAAGGGLVPFDGQGHKAFSSDIKFRNARLHGLKMNFGTGSMLKTALEHSIFLSEQPPSHGEPPARHVWYGEHENAAVERDGYSTAAYLRGGVAACSTTDFQTWKNEGIVLNSVNLTNMVEEIEGPLHIERPKVIYNNMTRKYIMWMIIDNEERDLAMAGVAVSDFATGPYDFVRSFYPDGNQTRDQTLLQDADGSFYLVRSYYTTVDFVLPSPIMQPTWESVKNADGDINFALSYHRANYEPNYDNYHDIYLQRWRTEDKPWKVVCVDRITGKEREVSYGKKNINFNGETCNDPYELKRVIGQGSPLQENTKNGIPSQFLDPTDTVNNAWMPNSVPGVKAQPWYANYKDGLCGTHKANEDKQSLDPSLPGRESITDRGDCSNISDNPIHPTSPDKLIGSNHIVEQRRAKFVAVSRLTDDYLDTSGILTSYEGELEDGMDLITLINLGRGSANPFGWTSGQDLSSTFHPQRHSPHFGQAEDWDTRLHQYEENFNDKALYSTACVNDGQCPVNFKDQVALGHN